MKSCVLLLTLFFASLFTKVQQAFGQNYIQIFSQDYRSRFSVEVDPITFLFKGHSLQLRYQPMFSERFLLGAGTYGLDLPEVMVDLNRINRDQGWNVRIRSAYFLYGELYATEANDGWFIGEQVGFQSFKVTNDRDERASARFNNLLFLTYVGYSWHPYKGSFYIKPWIGLGLTEKVDGLNTVGTMRYDVSPLFGFLTFHFGYTF